jgi:hypothetical protein
MIPMASRVLVYMMLRPLPPSISTLVSRMLPMDGVNNKQISARLRDAI